jgi:hypothetical protein
MNRHVEKGCLMARISPSYSPNIVKFGKTVIPPEILYTDPEDPTYGYDKEPHVTIKYGFVPDLPRSEIAKILKGISPFDVYLTGLTQFNNDKFDVVKFDVDKNNETLMELRRRCDQYPNVDSYPDYHPHMTLAYVKKGTFPHLKEGLKIKAPITGFKYSGPQCSFYVNF